MEPTLVGIHPRPEWLVTLTRDFDRGRASREELERGFEKAEKELMDLQGRLGFSPKVDGMYKWQDIFRPLTATIEGLEAGPLTRFFDNNTFYRRPLIRSRISYEGGMRDFFRGEKLILPGPFTFHVMSENRAYSSRESFEEDLLRIYTEIIDELKPKAVQLNEPALVYRYRKWEVGDEDIEAVSRFSRELDAWVHLYFGDGSSVYPKLAKMDVPGVGLDLVEGRPPTDDLGVPLLLGLVDGRNTYMEDLNHLVKLLGRFDSIRWVSSNCDLEFMPYEYAKRKMALLHALVEVVR